jgi:AraC family transcriptional regulator
MQRGRSPVRSSERPRDGAAPGSRLLAAGGGWRVSDMVCTAGPQDWPFEEQHALVCIAAVTDGTFQYRSTHGTATLAPGALLLGNAGQCFECSHDHGVGDRCLAFHFTPAFFEQVVAAIAGAQRMEFRTHRLPATPRLLPLVAAAEAARTRCDGEQLEELALRLAGCVVAIAAGSCARHEPQPSRRDERRVSHAVRVIEARCAEPIRITELARIAAMSPYHFIRTFRRVVGMTPHQYVLRTRLHRAAVRLRTSGEPVAAVAFDAGFNDLSTFNRRFRSIMGLSPSAFRARGQ